MFDCFIKIDTLPGECTDSKHKDWIEVMSFSVGVRQAGEATSAIGGLSTGRANFNNLSFTKLNDKSTPGLHKACAEGRHIKSTIMELCQAAGDKHCFMRYTLSDVLVSSVVPTGNTKAQEAKPLEEVSLNYTKINWEYTPIDQAGKPQAATKAEWDLKENKGA
ncbi:MAG: type VI secretion system tube protein Hcp [Planctomycetota bacterium]|nr:type VI secretion system tube protein Hcp [Planctomycetota bacterium]